MSSGWLVVVVVFRLEVEESAERLTRKSESPLLTVSPPMEPLNV